MNINEKIACDWNPAGTHNDFFVAFFFIVLEVEEHQYYHRKILQVQQEIDEQNAAIMELVEQLHQGREQLETLLDDARVTMKAMKLASDCKYCRLLL